MTAPRASSIPASTLTPTVARDRFTQQVRCAPSKFSTLPDDQAEGLDALFGGPPATTTALRRLASPITHVDPSTPPFLIVHGTHDETVPFEQAQSMADQLTANGVDVTLHRIDGVFHNLQDNIDLPWGSTPWIELGHRAVNGFTHTLKHQPPTA